MKNDASCPCEGDTLTGFVQPIILSCLKDGPCHGYVLMQKIGRTKLWATRTPDPAGVYRALRNMQDRGLVESVINPDARRGSEKTVYSLTEEGVHCAKSWIRTLKQYRSGINEVVRLLEDLADDFPDMPDDYSPGSCC